MISEPTGKKIKIGVISYIEKEGKQDNYRLHYWNSSTSGDVKLTAAGKTESVSVGSSYWSGDSKTFTIYEAVIPDEATGFKFHIGDRWFGSDGSTSKYDTVYIFNYSGDKAVYKKS